jgi:hypothetical protein
LAWDIVVTVGMGNWVVETFCRQKVSNSSV